VRVQGPNKITAIWGRHDTVRYSAKALQCARNNLAHHLPSFVN